MNRCTCRAQHHPHRIVLTGGPGAGKTAVLEMLQRSTCHHVHVLPESAGLLFGGGFPRAKTPEVQAPAQRAIFYVQRELEAVAATGNHALVLCDRGTIDGVAYWPGPPDEMWKQLGTSLDEQLARYDAVIHLRTPSDDHYNRANPLRVENVGEAIAIDARIAQAWQRHPRRYEIPATQDFMTKTAAALALIAAEVPSCCRPTHLLPMA